MVSGPRFIQSDAALSLLGHTPTVPLRFEPKGVVTSAQRYFSTALFHDDTSTQSPDIANVQRVTPETAAQG